VKPDPLIQSIDVSIAAAVTTLPNTTYDAETKKYTFMNAILFNSPEVNGVTIPFWGIFIPYYVVNLILFVLFFISALIVFILTCLLKGCKNVNKKILIYFYFRMPLVKNLKFFNKNFKSWK
jgi:hypothetical protein